MNPPAEGKGELTLGEANVRQGDKIMQIKNKLFKGVDGFQ